MSLEVFTGDAVPALLARARMTLGPDACIVQVRRRKGGFELIAADPATAAQAARPDFSEHGRAPVAPKPSRPVVPAPEAAEPAAEPRGRHARVIVLVGPTGAGKTTTIAKLAVNPLAFGVKSVGILGLDTYRVGAVEQLSTYAELAGIPIEIAYEESDLPRALKALDKCDVILVDTPGRGPRQQDDQKTIARWMSKLAADEIHLVLPAGRMPMVTRRTIEAYRSFGITHALATKLDECPDDERLFDVVVEHLLPMRWLTDGQAVPADLRAATARYNDAAVRVETHRMRREVAA